MTLREKIFEHLKNMKLGADQVWKFQDYNRWINDLTPPEKEAFFNEMNEMCAEGLFHKELDGAVFRYRLTKIGEKTLWEEEKIKIIP